MALNATELAIIAAIAGRLGRPARTLLLGYPDLLVLPKSLAAVGLDLDWGILPKRQNSASIWYQHGRNGLASVPMLESRAALRALGCNPFVVDFVKVEGDGGADAALNLNHPVRFWRRLGRFDLIIDPGTVEHCFNVAQAFYNIDRLLKPGGFVYHQAAAAFPNHGFWSISPTAFFDFYQSRGYECAKPLRISGAKDVNGFVVKLSETDAFKQAPGSPDAMAIYYLFRKSVRLRFKRKRYPIQRCYAGGAIEFAELWP